MTVKHLRPSQLPTVSSKGVLAPTLFSMIFSATLTDAFQHCTEAVGLKYRTDGKLFNLRRLRAITKVKETVLRDSLCR